MHEPLQNFELFTLMYKNIYFRHVYRNLFITLNFILLGIKTYSSSTYTQPQFKIFEFFTFMYKNMYFRHLYRNLFKPFRILFCYYKTSKVYSPPPPLLNFRELTPRSWTTKGDKKVNTMSQFTVGIGTNQEGMFVSPSKHTSGGQSPSQKLRTVLKDSRIFAFVSYSGLTQCDKLRFQSHPKRWNLCISDNKGISKILFEKVQGYK